MPKAKTRAVIPTQAMKQVDVMPTEPMEVDKVIATFLKHGFDPLEELIHLFRTGKSQIVTKEGAVIDFDMSVADRVSILRELMSYRYAKTRPAQGKAAAMPNYTIVINK